MYSTSPILAPGSRISMLLFFHQKDLDRWELRGADFSPGVSEQLGQGAVERSRNQRRHELEFRVELFNSIGLPSKHHFGLPMVDTVLV